MLKCSVLRALFEGGKRTSFFANSLFKWLGGNRAFFCNRDITGLNRTLGGEGTEPCEAMDQDMFTALEAKGKSRVVQVWWGWTYSGTVAGCIAKKIVPLRCG